MSDGKNTQSRGRPKTVDRQGAIERAMLNYWTEGPTALSVNEVCRRANISKPALYREFGNEDGLQHAVLAEYRALAIVPLLDLLTAPLAFAEVIELALVTMTSPREVPAGCLFTRMRLAGSRLGPKATAAVQQLERERRVAFVAWYERGLARREANPEIPAALAGEYIDTQITTVLVQMTAGESPPSILAQARLAFSVLTA